jgi:hypothetical protein
MLARCEEIRKKCAGSSKPVNHRYIEVTVPPAPISPPIFASAGCLEEPACTRGDLLEQSPGRIGSRGIAIYATKYGRCHLADRAKQAWRGPARFVRVDRSARRREARPRAVAHSPAGSVALLRRLGGPPQGWPGAATAVCDGVRRGCVIWLSRRSRPGACEFCRCRGDSVLGAVPSGQRCLARSLLTSYLNPLPFTPGH